jgi:hypothetical protein
MTTPIALTDEIQIISSCERHVSRNLLTCKQCMMMMLCLVEMRERRIIATRLDLATKAGRKRVARGRDPRQRCRRSLPKRAPTP